MSGFEDVMKDEYDFSQSEPNPSLEELKELRAIGNHGDNYDLNASLTDEDRAYIAHFRSVFDRHNINPAKATRLEYDFVLRVTESEFYKDKEKH